MGLSIAELLATIEKLKEQLRDALAASGGGGWCVERTV
jgi:hypothetical protein